MNIAEIIELVRGSLREEDLVPVKKLKDKNFVDEVSKRFHLPTYEQIEELAKKLETSVEYFFIDLKGLTPIVYFHDGLLLEIHAYDDDYIRDFQVKERLNQGLKVLRRCIQENNYMDFFIRVDSRVRILLFKRLFNEIPDKDLYEIFLTIYSHADYGFTEIDEKYFSRIIRCKSKQQQQKIEKSLKKEVDKDGFITVYRGVGSKSTPPDKAYSWTIDIGTAAFFASRFSEAGDIYTGKVHIKDVIAYIDSRNEKEILALPGKVKEIKKMDLLNIERVVEDFPDLMEDYVIEAGDIKDKYFLNPESIHGVLHAKRVLLLAYIIGLYEELDDNDMEIVLNAAKYHDIGRTNDNYDEMHGILSFNKMLQLELVDKEMEDIHILQFIMENHCIDDKKGLANLEKYPIEDKNRAIRLYQILKDADGLDRVRLGDLDINYLRLPISKRLVLVAQQTYRNLK
jgi:hypothetical protein